MSSRMHAIAAGLAERVNKDREPLVIDDPLRAFNRAVREQFGMVRSFWLSELGPRGVMLACREAIPRNAAERDNLAALHRWANRLAEREPPILPARRL
ncbi:MAG: hypothetical protein FJX40_13840 [Alphaproteobacteria bacterium]|nr:hypothetical protein [Alphaproteobacteria bacterium]